MKRIRRSAAFGTLVFLCACAYAQEGRVIVLHHADTLVGKVINGEDARELIGHVDIGQDTVRIHCDHAIQMLRSGVVVLYGNVVINDRETTLKAPRGFYYRDERRAEAFDSVRLDDGKTVLTSHYGQYMVEPREGFFRGDVRVVDSTSDITADSLWYYRVARRSTATGRVRVTSETDRVTITGGRLEHDQNTGFSRMSINPMMVQVDTGGSVSGDTLVVRSKIMEAYRDSTRRMLAIDSVRLAGRDISGRAGYAEFLSRGDSLILRQSPVVWYEDTQVSGDSMRIYLLRRKLQRVFVAGNVIAVSRSDSLHPDRFDQMVGDVMQMIFAEKALKQVIVDNHAISLYHTYDDSTANGLNKASGDRIVMAFVDGKLRTIKITGGVEGQYVPENIVRLHATDYDLPGASWRADRPKMARDARGNARLEEPSPQRMNHAQ